MKVVQISGAYVGAQKIIQRAIHKECIARGYESYVFYAIGKADEEGILCYETKIASLFRRALRKYFGKNSRFARWSTEQLIHRLKQIQPDLVNLHVLHQGYLDYEYLFQYLIKNKISVVYTAHDMWAFTGGCYHYTKENCAGFQTGCRECPALSERMDNPPYKADHHFKLKKNLFSQLNGIQLIAVSQWVADEMKKSFLSGYPIAVIENGIEPLPFPTSSNSISDAKHDPMILIGVAAIWDERKGIDRIFEMARILGDRYQFHLVGSASEGVMEKAPPNVCFLGYICDRSTLLKLYAEADLHISASFEETFGMTFIEAAFVGTRSIGYAATAVKSTLEGVQGIAIGELNAQAMAKEIEKISKSGEIKLSPEEVQQAVSRYSSEMMAKKYSDVYQSVIEKEINS